MDLLSNKKGDDAYSRSLKHILRNPLPGGFFIFWERGVKASVKELVVKYWFEFALGVVAAGAIAFYKQLEGKVHKQFTDQKALKEGMLALLRSGIISNYEKYMKREWIPIYAMENVLALYDAYHALGGNGAVDKLIDELKDLRCTEQK